MNSTVAWVCLILAMLIVPLLSMYNSKVEFSLSFYLISFIALNGMIVGVCLMLNALMDGEKK